MSRWRLVEATIGGTIVAKNLPANVRDPRTSADLAPNRSNGGGQDRLVDQYLHTMQKPSSRYASMSLPIAAISVDRKNGKKIPDLGFVDRALAFCRRMREDGAMSESKHTYTGGQVDVCWDGRLCIHVGECGRSAGELFVGGRNPWCQPDLGGSVEEVADVCRRCPTGALTYQRKDGVLGEIAPGRNQVVIANDGPLYFTGDLSIDGAAEDMDGVRYRAALCRCGQSKNKPFCDNSHREARFADQGAVGSTGEPSIEEGGKLEVKRAPNGPLLVNGSFTIVTGAGRVAWRGTRAALCRCGASKNKPFCDGSHRAEGFEAE